MIKHPGFSLVELLVALVVASVGLLGVATLSLQATRYNHDAKLRNQATLLASDMAERIRANPVSAVINYPAAGTGTDNSCDTASPPCTPAQRAEQDVLEWNARVTGQLPVGTWSIVAATPDLIITVNWKEIVSDYNINRGSGGGTADREIIVTVRP